MKNRLKIDAFLITLILAISPFTLAQVTSFNTRTGAVTLNSTDVTAAIGATGGVGFGPLDVPVLQNDSGNSLWTFPNGKGLHFYDPNPSPYNNSITVTRSSNYTCSVAGTCPPAGWVDSPVRADVTVGSDSSVNEWSITGTCTTSSTWYNASCVGVFGQGNRNIATYSPIWGGVFEARDMSGLVSSSSAAVVGQEIDISANKADDALNPDMVGNHGNRVGSNFVPFNWNNDTTLAEISTGYWVNPTYNDNVFVDDAFSVGQGMMVRTVFDARGGVVPTGSTMLHPMALEMAPYQSIEFNHPASNAFGSANSRWIRYNTNTAGMEHIVDSKVVFSVNDDATVKISSVIYANLPAPGTLGRMIICRNCLKPGEAAAHGTGMLVFDDGTNWISTAGTVAAH